jgi:uncharacterized membrane protein YhhN
MTASFDEIIPLATVIVSLAAATAYWLVWAARAEKGPVGAAVKASSVGVLALMLATFPAGGWFWLIALGLALGALGDLMLALGGVQRFLAGVAAFGLGHLAYAGGFVARSGELGFDGLSGAEIVALVALGLLVASTELWLASRTGGLRQPVRVYVGLIGVTGVAAVMLPAHHGQGVLRLGTALFILSDLLLAFQLFVAKGEGVRLRLALTLWPAYWVAQVLIAAGAVMYWSAKG